MMWCDTYWKKTSILYPGTRYRVVWGTMCTKCLISTAFSLQAWWTVWTWSLIPHTKHSWELLMNCSYMVSLHGPRSFACMLSWADWPYGLETRECTLLRRNCRYMCRDMLVRTWHTSSKATVDGWVQMLPLHQRTRTDLSHEIYVPCVFTGAVMHRVSCGRWSQRSDLEKSIDDWSHSWFDRYNLVGNFLMESRQIVWPEHVLSEKFSRTYVLWEHTLERNIREFV